MKPANKKPVVCIFVNGGIMDYMAPSSIRVVSFDWDNLELGDIEELDMALKEAALIPKQWGRKSVVDRINAIKAQAINDAAKVG